VTTAPLYMSFIATHGENVLGKHGSSGNNIYVILPLQELIRSVISLSWQSVAINRNGLGERLRGIPLIR